jgi:hypothetical protein
MAQPDSHIAASERAISEGRRIRVEAVAHATAGSVVDEGIAVAYVD